MEVSPFEDYSMGLFFSLPLGLTAFGSGKAVWESTHELLLSRRAVEPLEREARGRPNKKDGKKAKSCALSWGKRESGRRAGTRRGEAGGRQIAARRQRTSEATCIFSEIAFLIPSKFKKHRMIKLRSL